MLVVSLCLCGSFTVSLSLYLFLCVSFSVSSWARRHTVSAIILFPSFVTLLSLVLLRFSLPPPFFPSPPPFLRCGTPDYFAPEIILGQGHTKSVDWWALGVLIYELVAGYPPFVDETVKNTYARIVKGVVEYPRSFSPCLVDLLSRLLEMMPDKRLGATLEGADAIKSHPWFAGFDWCSLESGQMQPPILPNLDDQPDPVDVRKFSSFTCSLVEHRGLTAAGDENDQDSYRGHPWSSAVQFHQQMRKYSVPVHHGSWAQCSGS